MLIPDELKAKKRNVPLTIALNILLCKLIEALIQIDTDKADLTWIAITIQIIKMAYTKMHIWQTFVDSIIKSDESRAVKVPFSKDTLFFFWKIYSSWLTLKINKNLNIKIENWTQ